MADLAQITPPKDLSPAERTTIFDHLFRRLASQRNTAVRYALVESELTADTRPRNTLIEEAFDHEVNVWAQALLEHAWVVCEQPGACPRLDPLADTSTGDLPHLPPPERLAKVLNTILFLHITTAKRYSARTRAFLGTFAPLDEHAIVATLKHPDQAIAQTQKQIEATKDEHAQQGRALRMAGMGLGAVAGGILIGVTGGLAAPLVGAGVAAIFGALGMGGTVVGLLASGLAGSSVVCGALFGAYGARSTANMVERHTREIRDLAIVPVLVAKEETLAVRLCISGWLSTPDDVTEPWKIFTGDDTFALQWEVEALEALSGALQTLAKAQAIKYVKGEIIKRTVLASLMSSLAPMALLKIGQIIDNPWMNAKALAIKAGAALADLLANGVFGTRPVTLTGYSLGALVIFEALQHLARRAPAETAHLVQDVFLFGTPAPTDPAAWARARRVVAGRLVNGYADGDYVLAVLARASDASWAVAGLEAVETAGVENVFCAGVDGHTRWRAMVGAGLAACGAAGVEAGAVEAQVRAHKDDLEAPASESAQTGPADRGDRV